MSTFLFNSCSKNFYAFVPTKEGRNIILMWKHSAVILLFTNQNEVLYKYFVSFSRREKLSLH